MIFKYIFLVYVIYMVGGINRSAYKISVTQKGYTQFLEYDIDTPPLREFTFCTWIRVFTLEYDQPIFTYVVRGNLRLLKLWLEAGGRNLLVSINYQLSTNINVDWREDVWRHVCFSYQSDFGAWAVYIDGTLELCETANSLVSYIFPAGGSIIIGYGTAENSEKNGLEGEIFGFYMMLSSTIERNFTIKSDSRFKDKSFKKNKVVKNNNVKYVVLGDLDTAKSNLFQESKQNTALSSSSKPSRNYIKFSTRFSNIDHFVGRHLTEQAVNEPSSKMLDNDMEIFDFTTQKVPNSRIINDKFNAWNIINSAGVEGNLKKYLKSVPSDTILKNISYISTFETPPKFGEMSQYNIQNSIKTTNIETHKNNDFEFKVKSNSNHGAPFDIISEVETPPPLQKDDKVYGIWTGFPKKVLNFLKNTNFYNTKNFNVIPPTIPLPKVSDSFPYPSDFKPLRLPTYIQNRKLQEHLKIKKRDIKLRERNVVIENDGLREDILKSHAATRPTEVNVTYRGETVNYKDDLYKINSYEIIERENNEEDKHPKPLKHNLYSPSKVVTYKRKTLPSKMFSILPFLKSFEYYVHNIHKNENISNEKDIDMYSNSLSKKNKWHNVKSYSNDYAPRNINLKELTPHNILDNEIALTKKKPSLRLNYKHEVETPLEIEEDDAVITRGRELAYEVANQSNSRGRGRYVIMNDNLNRIKHSNKYDINKTGEDKYQKKSNFHKHVKIGNALDERVVIGLSEKDKHRSFIGGDDKVPDINRYRSDIDAYSIRNSGKIPPSLSPKICKTDDIGPIILYVQNDGTIDSSKFVSPLKSDNIAIHFVSQSYKRCLLDETVLQYYKQSFIDWSKTPVRLFGGAYVKETKDLCGFF